MRINQFSTVMLKNLFEIYSIYSKFSQAKTKKIKIKGDNNFLKISPSILSGHLNKKMSTLPSEVEIKVKINKNLFE